mmetsp:Transcript_3035/g.5503  ORF Transcript_3035/g.5503 Transcript_3035/m.5503 type:complete len:155 (-) Transcript_3035:2016-2480(-)|eukprot:CAMPEP_0168607948 /NCGR_PEP_ID=MMETSP0449_2-20121227/355_1 /TAXON_ID=1082188 /ORGANISM="Strombidium rassoulzadegani, Strain ras09" /LENGTH=154 /DNA_ID=CAMNT_0008647879 /DNA_START=91 /DNA_END=555 /DNA_ORIENTATION=+
MGMFGFLGRLAFAFLFISSGVQKLQTFEPQSGGPVAENILPYIQKAVADVSTFAQLSIQLDDIKPLVPALFATACGLEILGGVLFIFGSRIGAVMLMLFLLSVTPVMHAFWDPSLEAEQQQSQMIQFFKNVALFGALMVYCDTVSGRGKKTKTE